MLLDPNENEQNAERILAVWKPVLECIKQAKREKLRPTLIALHCSFRRADWLAAQPHVHERDVKLWATMATVPSSVVHIITVKAGLFI